MFGKNDKEQPASVRQYVSLCIFVFVVSSVFVLNYLSNEQWFVPTYAATDEDPDKEATSILKSQTNVLEEKGITFFTDTDIGLHEKTALIWRPEDLGFGNSDESMIKPSEKQQKSLESEKVLKARLSALLMSRNPCWQTNKARLGLACLPSFYLAGFPMCGTTDLYQRVIAHPDIASSPPKDLHWITRGRFASKTSLENYEEFFGEVLLRSSPVGGNWSSRIVGDHSSSTLWDNRHWQRLPGNDNCSVPRVITADVVHHLNRDAKIVIIVRNPTDRLYSEYMFFNGNATKEELHSQVAKDTQRATDCFQRNSVRWCIYNVLQEMTLRLHVGLYAVYIEDWLKRFPRDQLHVLRLEDLALNPYKEVTAVHTFLDLGKADDEATLETVVNPQVSNAGRHRSHRAGPMLPKTRAILDTFYHPFNARLAQVLRNEKYQ